MDRKVYTLLYYNSLLPVTGLTHFFTTCVDLWAHTSADGSRDRRRALFTVEPWYAGTYVRAKAHTHAYAYACTRLRIIP